MIRQLYLPTWFMSLSAADTRWTDLLRMLAVPDPRGGLRGTCPPEEAKSAFKNDKKTTTFFPYTAERKGEEGGGGAQIEL